MKKAQNKTRKRFERYETAITEEQRGRDDRENNGTEPERCEGRQDKEATNSSQSKEKTVSRQRDKGRRRAGGANDDVGDLLASARMGEDGLKERRGEGARPASFGEVFIWIVMWREGTRQDQGLALQTNRGELNPEPRSASWDLWEMAFYAYHLRQITRQNQETLCSTLIKVNKTHS